MLPNHIENYYTAAFQLLGADTNDPLLLSGWYCIAQWVERFSARDRTVSEADILSLLQNNPDLQSILRLCELDSFPIASRTYGLTYLVNKVIRPFGLIGNRAVMFYHDFLCCALFDNMFEMTLETDGPLHCSLIRLCMIYAGERLGSLSVLELLPPVIYHEHLNVFTWFHIHYEDFEKCWNSVHSCSSSSPARKRPGIMDAVKLYAKFNTPQRFLLEQYALASGLDPKEIRASENPLEYIQKKSESNQKEGGLKEDEKLFLNAAYQISREMPTDVVQTAFYRNRDDSKLECMLVRTEIARVQQYANTFLLVNPSPMFLVEFNRTDELKREKLNGYRVVAAVLDDVLCAVYRRQFPEYDFICIDQLSIVSETFDCVVVLARDYDRRADLWKGFQYGRPGAYVIAAIPQTSITQKDEIFVEEWFKCELGIRAVFDVPEKLCHSNPQKKAVFLGQRIQNPTKTFRLLSGVTDLSGDWFVLDKHHDVVPVEYLIRRMTLAQMRNAVRNRNSPEARNILVYFFSQEIQIEYTLIKEGDEIKGAKAHYRTIHRPKLHPQSTKGKRIIKNFERGLRGQSLEEILPKLESTALLDEFSSNIVNDVRDYYKDSLSYLTLKSMWYCCRDELSCKLSYDEDIAKEFFCGNSQALSNLQSGVCTADDVVEAMKALYGENDISKRIWLQMNLIFQTAVEEGLIKRNPLITHMVVVKDQNKERLYMLNAALKKSHFTDAEESRMIAFLQESVPVPGKESESAPRYVVESKWLCGAFSLFEGIPVREICLLLWEDIQFIEDDLEEMQIIISKHLNEKGDPITNVNHKNKHLFRKIAADMILTRMLLDRNNFVKSRYRCTDEKLGGFPIMLEDEPIRGRDLTKCKPISRATANKVKKKLLEVARIPEETISLLEGDARFDVNLNAYRTDLFAANFRHKAFQRCWFTEGELCYHLGNRGPDTYSEHYCDYSDDFVQYDMVHKLYRWSYIFDSENSTTKSVRKCGTISETGVYNSGRYAEGRADANMEILPSEDAEGTVIAELEARHGLNVDASAYKREE